MPVQFAALTAEPFSGNEATDGLLGDLSARLSAGAVLFGDGIDLRYSDDCSGKPGARPLAVLRPRNTSEVAMILKACDAARHPLTVQGGRTGLAGSARVRPGEMVLSLERLTALEPVDTQAATIIADAGVPMQLVQQSADAAGLMLGVDIGARGSATIGGNIATNAGGIRVLRYGMFRAQVLGLEAVLADGSILSSLKGLSKDNSGYDLSQLFIGSEGTLGVVTRACLRLHPKPAYQANAFGAVPSLEAAITLLAHLRQELGPKLSAFEIIFAPIYEAMLPTLGGPAPLPAGSFAYVLAEAQGNNEEQDGEAFGALLMQGVEDGLLTDAVISQSQREWDAIWTLRDHCSRHAFTIDRLVGFDIGLSLSGMAAFLQTTEMQIRAADPTAEFICFGHLGDGNLHYMVRTHAPNEVAGIVYNNVGSFGGALSAEHGVGLDKKEWLGLVRTPAELAAMRRLKKAFDPNTILNPGRVFDLAPGSSV